MGVGQGYAVTFKIESHNRTAVLRQSSALAGES